MSKLSTNKALNSDKKVKSTIKFALSICQEAILLAHNSSVSHCQQIDSIAAHDLAGLADQILKLERQIEQLNKSSKLQMEIDSNLRNLIGSIEYLAISNNKKISLH